MPSRGRPKNAGGLFAACSAHLGRCLPRGHHQRHQRGRVRGRELASLSVSSALCRATQGLTLITCTGHVCNSFLSVPHFETATLLFPIEEGSTLRLCTLHASEGAAVQHRRPAPFCLGSWWKLSPRRCIRRILAGWLCSSLVPGSG